MIARVRRARTSDDEGGFALIFVLLVTTLVITTVLAALTLVAPNIVSSRRTQDVLAAQVAAQSGVDDLIAYLSSIPSCRSETRICPQALGASSDALNSTSRARPSLGTDQSVTWRTASTATSEDYVRVTSTGTSNKTTRTLVADLSLQPSILAYGYYTDYESFAPQYLNDYYNARDVYLSNSTTYNSVSSTNRNGATAPQTVTWKGAAEDGTSARCGQHWYYESPASPGRATYTTQSNPVTQFGENGTNNSTAASSLRKSVSRTSPCDLVFTSAMVEDGLTFSRDAIFSSGSGPIFNKPVYTMWGYTDGAKNYNNPAFTTAGQYYRGTAMATGTNASPNKPAIAAADLVLPKSIGTDALSEDSCVYYGPTRVKLNGDGTATVTSPSTRTKFAGSDPACYPTGSIGSTGVLGWPVTYATTGSGTIIVRNLGTAPATGWPANPTKSTNTPSATNEVFYLPPTGNTDVTQHTNNSTASSSGCTGTGYSAAVSATCGWTNLNSASNVGAGTGWSSYGSGTCGTAQTTDRQLFECEYGAQLTNAKPAVNLTGGQYKVVRDNVQADLAKNTCLTGSATVQAACVNAIVASRVSAANTASTPPQSGDHRYVATSVAGTPTTTVVTGTVTGPVTSDPLFTQPTPASETLTRTPITTTVTRQRYSSGTWAAAGNAFTVTTTQSSYSYTPASGVSYFPQLDDVTEYNTGVDANGATVGSTGVRQPGDLYVDGGNKGKLSLVADNDVIITGNVTNPAGYTGATDAMSIVAGRNVRNYHPVSCDDQDSTDITRTSPGWCPNDITGLTTASLLDSNGYFTAVHPTQQYDNMQAIGDRTIDAAIFALSGSFRTDNYDRADWVGNLNVNGGIYQSARGGNGVVFGGSSNARSGTTLQYDYVDLQRADLPYAPPSTSGNYTRSWNVVSVSAGKS